ncbi:hypothetical protein Mucpa_4985 [Mucilaginibacter paludis DSM 18603]|uniref:Uncharacterized protein n=1 Tax=Mucilaginibacter paludis DSM 18603 TaxID=714943 RepID=H1Y926_9SPHI|nr:hypothetical protein Mucpa_4985 [Mucilaginibacter paludis DSM 18603]
MYEPLNASAALGSNAGNVIVFFFLFTGCGLLLKLIRIWAVWPGPTLFQFIGLT